MFLCQYKWVKVIEEFLILQKWKPAPQQTNIVSFTKRGKDDQITFSQNTNKGTTTRKNGCSSQKKVHLDKPLSMNKRTNKWQLMWQNKIGICKPTDKSVCRSSCVLYFSAAISYFSCKDHTNIRHFIMYYYSDM